MASTNVSKESYALISTYGVYDRDLRTKLDMEYPRAGALSWMKMAKNYTGKRKVKRFKYDYWEESQWFNAAATIESAADSGSNSIVTLSSADHQDSGVNSYPRVNDLAVFEDETVGFVSAKSESVASAHTVTVKPLNPSQDVQAAAVAGTKIAFFSNAMPEESTSRESHVSKQTKVSNYVQTFREEYKVTDHAMLNAVEFEWKGQNYLYVKDTDDTANRFELQEELGCLITPLSSSLTDASSNSIQTTNALIPQITDNGYTQEYFDEPDLTDFEDMVIGLNDKFAGKKYIAGIGINLSVKLNRFLKDQMTQNPEVFFSELGDGGQQLNFNFRRLDYNDYQFQFQTWEIFGHADSLGAGNMPYRHMAVMIPIGTAKDPDSGADEPYIKTAYADPGGAAHENFGDYKMFETGANAQRGATNATMNRVFTWVSYKGLELRHRKKFALWRMSMKPFRRNYRCPCCSQARLLCLSW